MKVGFQILEMLEPKAISEIRLSDTNTIRVFLQTPRAISQEVQNSTLLIGFSRWFGWIITWEKQELVGLREPGRHWTPISLAHIWSVLKIRIPGNISFENSSVVA